MTNQPIPTFNQLKESGEFKQWLEWSDEDWENIPETTPDLEKYRALKTGSIMQQDHSALLKQAQQGDLFAQCAAAIILRESNPEQSAKYVQNLCQNRFYFFLILFVSNPAAASFFEIDLPRIGDPAAEQRGKQKAERDDHTVPAHGGEAEIQRIGNHELFRDSGETDRNGKRVHKRTSLYPVVRPDE